MKKSGLLICLASALSITLTGCVPYAIGVGGAAVGGLVTHTTQSLMSDRKWDYFRGCIPDKNNPGYSYYEVEEGVEPKLTSLTIDCLTKKIKEEDLVLVEDYDALKLTSKKTYEKYKEDYIKRNIPEFNPYGLNSAVSMLIFGEFLTFKKASIGNDLFIRALLAKTGRINLAYAIDFSLRENREKFINAFFYTREIYNGEGQMALPGAHDVLISAFNNPLIAKKSFEKAFYESSQVGKKVDELMDKIDKSSNEQLVKIKTKDVNETVSSIQKYLDGIGDKGNKSKFLAQFKTQVNQYIDAKIKFAKFTDDEKLLLNGELATPDGVKYEGKAVIKNTSYPKPAYDNDPRFHTVTLDISDKNSKKNYYTYRDSYGNSKTVELLEIKPGGIKELVAKREYRNPNFI